MAYFDKYGVEFSDDRKTLVRCPEDFKGKYIIPETIETIGESAFFNCVGLESIVLSKIVTNISKCAFAYCINIKSIIIPNSVKTIGEFAFGGCKGLISITIPNSVTRIESEAFCDCIFLDKAYLPNSLLHVGKGAFKNCGNLIIYIPDGKKDYFAQMEGLKYFGNQLIEYKMTAQQVKPSLNNATSFCQGAKAKEEEHRKLVEKRKQEQEQTAKANRRIIIFIIIAILGAIMLFNAKCSKTRSNHNDLFDPAMEYRHS